MTDKLKPSKSKAMDKSLRLSKAMDKSTRLTTPIDNDEPARSKSPTKTDEKKQPAKIERKKALRDKSDTKNIEDNDIGESTIVKPKTLAMNDLMRSK